MMGEQAMVPDESASPFAAMPAPPPPTGDIFSREPTKNGKIEMLRASKPPSEWLRLLCPEWAAENTSLVDSTDRRLREYKPYLRGLLTSQLLCRLSTQPADASKDEHGVEAGGSGARAIDFWKILGIDDEFDKSYVVSQVERFAVLYSIRGGFLDDDLLESAAALVPSPVDAATAAAAGITVSPSGGIAFLSPQAVADPATVATAAAAAVAAADAHSSSRLTKRQALEVAKAQRSAKDAEKALEAERRNSSRKDQRRATQEKKEIKSREKEAQSVRKAADRAAKEATREERRQEKLRLRRQRERFAQEQKNAALRRCAELVQSNRVPIEITRGAAAAQAAANAAVAAVGGPTTPLTPEPASQKKRSAIVVSTAADLHAIVTHSKNLWTKYNAIAKEHNQKVNWIVVAKELGIHVKVREKYARMHSRAEQRGFDWVKCGHYRIKDHPDIFLEPTQAEQRAKMPPPPPDESRTVLIEGTREAAAAAAAAAAAMQVLPSAAMQVLPGAAGAVTIVPPLSTAPADPTAVVANTGAPTHPQARPPAASPADPMAPQHQHQNQPIPGAHAQAPAGHAPQAQAPAPDPTAAAVAQAAAAQAAAAQAAEAVDVAIKSEGRAVVAGHHGSSATMADATVAAMAAAPEAKREDTVRGLVTKDEEDAAARAAERDAVRRELERSVAGAAATTTAYPGGEMAEAAAGVMHI